MDILKIVLMIIFAIDCIALTIVVLMQEGKSAGLVPLVVSLILTGDRTRDVYGRCTGEVYKNSFAILFIVLAAVLNLKVFA